MKTNETAIEAQAQSKDELDVGFINVLRNHRKPGVKRGITKYMTADEFVAAFENLLDAGLAYDRDFTMSLRRYTLRIPGLQGRILDIYHSKLNACAG